MNFTYKSVSSLEGHEQDLWGVWARRQGVIKKLHCWSGGAEEMQGQGRGVSSEGEFLTAFPGNAQVKVYHLNGS